MLAPLVNTSVCKVFTVSGTITALKGLADAESLKVTVKDGSAMLTFEYTGAALTATVAVTASAIVGVTAGSVADFSIPFSNHSTLQSVVDAVAADVSLADWTVTLATGASASWATADLNIMAATDAIAAPLSVYGNGWCAVVQVIFLKNGDTIAGALYLGSKEVTSTAINNPTAFSGAALWIGGAGEDVRIVTTGVAPGHCYYLLAGFMVPKAYLNRILA